MPVTTRTATVLFTDLVGSVETAARLGPAAADQQRRQHDSLVADVIAAHRGTVVKGLGDGVMATFDSASDAVSAAIELQRAVHRHNRRHTESPFSLRIGVSAGDVTFEGGDCFGAPVAEASRLCQASTGGRILAADLVRLTARGLAGAPFRVAADVAIRNWPEPIDVVEVEWEVPEESRTPLPPRLTTAREFVGRRDELDRLDNAYRSAEDGQGRQVVLVQGEPGMGKSSLAIQAVRSWHGRGASIGMGTCDEELSMPYAPVTAAVDHLVRHAPPHLLTAHVARHGGAARHLVPALALRTTLPPPPVNADPQTERYLGFAAVADLLISLGEDSPVILLLEDLHWADAATLTLLRHLIVNTPGARLLILATYRHTETFAGHPLQGTLTSLHRVEGVTRVGLAGLSSADIASLVSARAARALGPDPGRTLAGRLREGGPNLAAQLAEETGGNPFFVSELLDHLLETDRLGQVLSGTSGSPLLASPEGGPDLPDSIREVVGARVTRLGSEVLELLTVASAIGVRFDVDLLAEASGRPTDEALAALDRARAAQLVREIPGAPGRMAFSHALVPHTLLQIAGATRQAALHQRVAMAMERSEGGAGRQAELAYHWGLAVHTVHAQRARDYARRAADEAIDALAPDEAARWYERALELHGLSDRDDVATRIDLLTALGEAQRQAGSGRYRQTLLDAAVLARDRGDAARLTRAMVANNRGIFTAYGRIDAEKVAMLEQALAMADVDDLAARSELTATLANELTYNGDYAGRRVLADEAIALARKVGRPDLLYRVLNLVFHPLWTPETLQERLAMSAESVALAEAVGDPGIRFWAEHRHSINLMQAGLLTEAERSLASQGELADRLSQPLHRWVNAFSNGARRFVAGDYAGGEELVAEAVQLGQDSDQPEALTFFQIGMMHVFWQSGRQFDLALGEAMIAQLPGAPAIEGGVALLAADSGQYDAASALLGRAASRNFAHITPDPAYLTGMVSFAEVAILLRLQPAAETLFRTLQPWADQWVCDGIGCAGPVGHMVGGLAGVLGRYDEAESLLRKAADDSRRLGARFFEARAEVELGRLLCERAGPGDLAAAARHFSTARGLAEEGSYAAVGRRVAEMAQTSRT